MSEKKDNDKPIQATVLSSSDKVKGVVANIRARGLKDLTDRKTWRAFKQWQEIEENGLVLPPEDIVAFAEQLVFRMIHCQPCVQAGKCIACNCAMPQGMCCAAYKCKQGRWNEMMSPEEWWEFFQKNYEFSIIPKST